MGNVIDFEARRTAKPKDSQIRHMVEDNEVAESVKKLEAICARDAAVKMSGWEPSPNELRAILKLVEIDPDDFALMREQIRPRCVYVSSSGILRTKASRKSRMTTIFFELPGRYFLGSCPSGACRKIAAFEPEELAAYLGIWKGGSNG